MVVQIAVQVNTPSGLKTKCDMALWNPAIQHLRYRDAAIEGRPGILPFFDRKVSN